LFGADLENEYDTYCYTLGDEEISELITAAKKILHFGGRGSTRLAHKTSL